jgi:hypothetical protein
VYTSELAAQMKAEAIADEAKEPLISRPAPSVEV